MLYGVKCNYLMKYSHFVFIQTMCYFLTTLRFTEIIPQANFVNFNVLKVIPNMCQHFKHRSKFRLFQNGKICSVARSKKGSYVHVMNDVIILMNSAKVALCYDIVRFFKLYQIKKIWPSLY